MIFLVISDKCNDQIYLPGRQEESSVYCSSCSTFIDKQTSTPIIQLELPTLTEITGIFIQNSKKNPETNSV